MKSKDLKTHDSVFVAPSFFKVPNDVLPFSLCPSPNIFCKQFGRIWYFILEDLGWISDQLLRSHYQSSYFMLML